jgi:DNA polymerase III subunit delta'
MNEIWDVVFKQEKAKSILENICRSRRVPHAFLFSGIEGVGKYFTAIQFAKYLNIKNNPSYSETIQKRISQLQEPYLKLIIPLPRGKGENSDDSATEKLSKEVLETVTEEIQKKIINPYYQIKIDNANTIKINSIREIKKFVTTTLEEVAYRFIFILNADLMNDQAQNALLKNLEEPPEGIIFILITSEKESLLQTIQSRCWQIDFEPLSVESVRDIMIKHFMVEQNLALSIANLSEGSSSNAISLLSQDYKILLDKSVSILRFSLGKKYASAYRELISFMLYSPQNSIIILTRLIKNWLNDTIKNKYLSTNYYFKDYEDTLTKFNARYNDSNTQKIFSILDSLENYHNKNANLNVVYLNLIFEIASLSIRI